MARDYRKEYDSYHGSPKQKKNRASRNAARRKMGKRLMGSANKDVHQNIIVVKNNCIKTFSIF